MKKLKKTAAVNNAVDTTAVSNRINGLITLRQQWETGVNTTANQQLYHLLSQCYQLHADMRDRNTLSEFCAYLKQQQPTFRFRNNTSTVSLVLRQVFSARRRQISAYNRALLVAEQRGVEPAKLAAFIGEAGGLEQLRLQSGNKRASIKTLAESARTSLVSAAPIATIPASKQLDKVWDSKTADDYAVLLARRGADGSWSVVRVIQNASAVRTALSKCAARPTLAISSSTVPNVELRQALRAAAVKRAVAA